MLKPLYVFAFLNYPDREDGWMSFNCIHLYVTQAQTPLTRVVTRPGMTDESHDHKTHYASGGILFKGAICSNFKAVSGVNITSSVRVKSDNRKKKKKCCSCLTKSISAVFQLLNISRTITVCHVIPIIFTSQPIGWKYHWWFLTCCFVIITIIQDGITAFTCRKIATTIRINISF